jgi:hypothetical protein
MPAFSLQQCPQTHHCPFPQRRHLQLQPPTLLPQLPNLLLKEEGKNNKPEQSSRPENEPAQKEKLKSTTVCALFPLLQVTVALIDSVRRQRRRRRSRSIGFAAFIGGGAWVTVARGATCRYCFCSFRELPGTIPEFFRVHFVNLKLFKVLFGLF